MIKAKAGGMLIDIVSPKELINSSSDDINRIGIIVNDVVYPLRSRTDSRPGVYPVSRYLNFLRNPKEKKLIIMQQLIRILSILIIVSLFKILSMLRISIFKWKVLS